VAGSTWAESGLLATGRPDPIVGEACSLTHFTLLTQLERVLAKLRPVLLALAMASCVDSGHLVATDGTPDRLPAPPTDQGGAAGSGSDDAGSGGAPSATQGCPQVGGGPAAVGPLPTRAQVAYQRTELTAFVHFGLETFDGTEFGDASRDTASLFDPESLDVTQWISALEEAGFGQAMLVAKHNTGFCLWPSAYTDYSVQTSPWKNGQGDVVREFVDAARAAGMRVGFYLSPWDQHFPSSDSDYETYFRNQLTELLTLYGPIDEIQMVGTNAPESPDWAGIATTGADIRYIGNQSGQPNRSQSSIGDVPGGGPANVWFPSEAPVSDRIPDWFWHPNGSVISLESLQTIYFDTVGMNSTLLLNVPPAASGRLDASDVDLLGQFGEWYRSLFENNLLRGEPVTADSTWSHEGFAAAQALDDDVCTYWAAAEGKTAARLEVTPASAITFTVISIREPIELGERVTGYHVELMRDGRWSKTPTDASDVIISGTNIGQRQLWQLGATTADAIALVIDSALAPPAIAEFAVY
jgi:alpha-L-fucosidase